MCFLIFFVLASLIKSKLPSSPTGELSNNNEFISRAEFERFCTEMNQKMEKMTNEILELKKHHRSKN